MSDEPDDTSAQSRSTSDAPAKKKWLPFRHKVLTSAALVLALLAGCSGGYWVWADRQLSEIPRADFGIFAMAPPRLVDGSDSRRGTPGEKCVCAPLGTEKANGIYTLETLSPNGVHAGALD
jgi:hypothetical protein